MFNNLVAFRLVAEPQPRMPAKESEEVACRELCPAPSPSLPSLTTMYTLPSSPSPSSYTVTTAMDIPARSSCFCSLTSYCSSPGSTGAVSRPSYTSLALQPLSSSTARGCS